MTRTLRRQRRPAFDTEKVRYLRLRGICCFLGEIPTICCAAFAVSRHDDQILSRVSSVLLGINVMKKQPPSPRAMISKQDAFSLQRVPQESRRGVLRARRGRFIPLFILTASLPRGAMIVVTETLEGLNPNPRSGLGFFFFFQLPIKKSASGRLKTEVNPWFRTC